MMEKTLNIHPSLQESPFIFSLRSQSGELFCMGRLRISTVIHPCNTICRIKDFRNSRVSLQASPEKLPTFQAMETKVLRVHPKTVNTPWLSMVAQPTPGKPLSPSWASVMLAKTALRMSMNWTKKLIYLEGWVSFIWINCAVLFLSCWHITGVAQGREKQARERSICLHWLKHLYNI